MAGARPEASRKARAMSRSRLMPGKTRTAARIRFRFVRFRFVRAPPRPSAAPDRRRGSECRSEASSGHLDAIILDHRVGKELVGGFPQQRFGGLGVAARKLDVEHLALAHAGHALDSERAERTLDRLALGVEDAGLQRDGDAGFHRSLQVLTRTGPLPCGRSFSLTMPSR